MGSTGLGSAVYYIGQNVGADAVNISQEEISNTFAGVDQHVYVTYGGGPLDNDSATTSRFNFHSNKQQFSGETITNKLTGILDVNQILSSSLTGVHILGQVDSARFVQGMGFNFTWDGANYVCPSNGVDNISTGTTNACAAILSNGGGTSFYNVPTTGAGANNSIVSANLNNYRVMSLGPTNGLQIYNSGGTFVSGITRAGIFQGPIITPASSSATCTTGQFENDASFMYVCTATNTWKRAALTTF